jgi:hypothetical protein
MYREESAISQPILNNRNNIVASVSAWTMASAHDSLPKRNIAGAPWPLIGHTVVQLTKAQERQEEIAEQKREAAELERLARFRNGIEPEIRWIPTWSGPLDAEETGQFEHAPIRKPRG